MIKITMNREIKGSILDIGGGGEGIIGRIYQSQVTAIDKSQEELDEAPGGFTKLRMDACDLQFEDQSFDNVSLFYSLMFIDKRQHRQVIKEAYRVLKRGGNLYIWDSVIQQADPFIVNLQIDTGQEIIETSYGIYDKDTGQDQAYVLNLCQKTGFQLLETKTEGDLFSFHLTKSDK